MLVFSSMKSNQVHPETPSYPGPWRFEEVHEEGIFNNSYQILAHDYRCPTDWDADVVICRLPTGTGKFSAHIGNAKLIAAAPAMLYALRKIAQDPYTRCSCAEIAQEALKLLA